MNLSFSLSGLPGTWSQEAAVCCEIRRPGGSWRSDNRKLQKWDRTSEPLAAIQRSNHQAVWLVSTQPVVCHTCEQKKRNIGSFFHPLLLKMPWWLQMCSQRNNQQLHLHADGVRKPGPEHVVTKPQSCESSGEEVLLEEHAGGRPNHPQTRFSFSVAPSDLPSPILCCSERYNVVTLSPQESSTVTWSQQILS